VGVKTKKRNNAWWVFVNFHGRRKAKKVGSRQAAERVKREIEARLVLGDFGFLDERKDLTFADYSERWLRQHADIVCKPSTVVGYRKNLRLYLIPHFGQRVLRSITRGQVKDFLCQWIASGKLSRTSVGHMLSTLRMVLNHAVEDNILAASPLAGLGRLVKAGKEKFKGTALTRDEIERFLAVVQAVCPKWYPCFLTALRTGLRRGELIALRWGDIQFGESDDDPDRFILVQRNYVYGEFTTPKSKKSRRVDLSRLLRATLLQLREERLLKAFADSKTSIADDLVFPSETGTVMDPDHLVRRYFLPALETAGIRRIRFHDLRHTFGSQLIEAGAPLTYVRDQMGHSSIQVTVDTYGHVIPGTSMPYVDRLDPSRMGRRVAAETRPQQNATQPQPDVLQRPQKYLQSIEKIGSGGGNRTHGLGIMRPSL